MQAIIATLCCRFATARHSSTEAPVVVGWTTHCPAPSAFLRSASSEESLYSTRLPESDSLGHMDCTIVYLIVNIYYLNIEQHFDGLRDDFLDHFVQHCRSGAVH